jgi:rhamnosyltransferase
MDVCAVFVTYHPDLVELERSLEILRPQVNTVVVVDNASPEDTRKCLRALTTRFSCQIIENAQNLGIAEALNQSICFAMSEGTEFVLFFDQDSSVRPNFVANEIEVYREESRHRKIGLVTPAIIKRSGGSRQLPVRLRDGSLILAQTSGALMPLTVFQDAGLFNAEMFIDYVDYEHCLRMARKGWQIAYAPEAELDHMPGNATPVRFLGRTISTVNASPARHYYEARNCLWLAMHYALSYPQLIARLVLRMGYVHLHALFFEQNRFAKLKANLHGASDAALNKLGPRSW